MNREQLLLLRLAEECTEVAQRCSKAINFGTDDIEPCQSLNNAERIIQEFNDLLGVMNLLVMDGVIREDYINIDAQIAKAEKVEKYMRLSRTLGILKD